MLKEPTKITDDISLLQSYWGDQQFKSCVNSDGFTSCIDSGEFKSCLGESSAPFTEISPISKLDLSDGPVFLSCISDSQIIGNNLSSNDSIIELPVYEPERPNRDPSPLELLFSAAIPKLKVFSDKNVQFLPSHLFFNCYISNDFN